MSDKIYYITEAWSNDDKNIFQVIQYRPDTKRKPEVNSKLKNLLYRLYYNFENEIIKEEHYDL